MVMLATRSVASASAAATASRISDSPPPAALAASRGGLDFSFDEGFLGAFAGRGEKRGEAHIAEHLLARGAGAVDDAERAAGNEHDRRRQEGDKGDPLRFGMAIHARLRLPS